MARRKVIVTEFMSLDGVMQAPGDADEDREGSFEHGGWQMPFNDDVMGKAAGEGMGSTDGLLLGRKTYEIFAAYWPNQSDEEPFAAFLNSIPKYVASTTLDEPLEWANSTLIKGDVAEGVRKLKDEPGKDLSVLGSGGLVQTLVEHGLVDEYALWIHPIVLGSGKRVFREGVPKLSLELVDTKTSTTGVLLLTYRPAEKE
jgi:dihydrofolate reductase